jgi:signal transduction histidine kinase
MRAIGAYLIFAAVALRAAVVVSAEPEFPLVLALLAVYGLLLLGETWLIHKSHLRFPQSITVQIAYLFLQSVLVIAVLILSSYEDFLAMLFIPLSLEAVSFFGRRVGYMIVASFSLAMIITLLFSDVGWLFGLVMGILYTGVCFLFGGYAYQVQKAKAAHDQNERMFNELQTAHHQLQGYTDQVAALAIEHERNRLARELHDSVTQTVFSMNLAVQSVHLLLDKEPPRAAGQLIRLEQLSASALREIQSLISQLKPYPSAEQGLPVALRRLALEYKAQYGLQVSLEFQGEDALPERVVANLYSIVHEALINVAKHSGRCDATVRLHVKNDGSCLEIEDHGRGFDPDVTLEQRGHLGLIGMFERAREIGWQLSVSSRLGQGTRIRVVSNPLGERE